MIAIGVKLICNGTPRYRTIFLFLFQANFLTQ